MSHFGRLKGNQNGDPLPAGRGFINDQPDMMEQAALLARLRYGLVPFEEVIKYLDNINIPPQIRYIPYNINFLTVNDRPQILIPANPNRMGFIVAFVDPAQNPAAPGSFVMMNYNMPVHMPPAGVPGNVGIPIPSGDSYQEGNGTVSIDDIVVGIGVAAAFPITVTGFEGVLAVESHLHKQTSGL